VAGETGVRLFVLDADGGAEGMRREIKTLVAELDVESVVVVDVGGDAVATGTEAELLSPLADALALASCHGLAVPVDVAIVGPGVDGELPESAVLGYLRQLGAVMAGTVTARDAESLAQVLSWHPTEATSLVAAAAQGHRGLVELRRGSISTALTDHSAEVWVARFDEVERHNQLVVPLAHTESLARAEEILGRWATSELIRERQRAIAFRSRRLAAPVPQSRIVRDVAAYSQEANRRGIALITARRLAEAAGHPELDIPTLTRALLQACPSAQKGSLWHVPTLATLEMLPA
jgi:hypothetical protein